MDKLMNYAMIGYQLLTSISISMVMFCLAAALLIVSKQNVEEKSKAKTFGKVVAITTIVVASLALILVVFLTIKTSMTV